MPPFSIKNPLRASSQMTVGDGKVGLVVNLGRTNNTQPLRDEILKAQTAMKFGASMIADVSTVGDIRLMIGTLLSEVAIPLNVVPLYSLHARGLATSQWFKPHSEASIVDVIEELASQGVDSMTVHASYPRRLQERVLDSPRRIRVQGRGGGIIHEYMQRSGCENPLYEHFDAIVQVLARYGVALSLGNCLRSGTVEDPIDSLTLEEVCVWRDLTDRARHAGVPVMLEGLSHLRYRFIRPYVGWLKTTFPDAAVRLLGPTGTERGLGYDHITAAICAVEAIRAGTDILTVVTRAEHIGLPSIEDIREALVGYRIALELATQSLSVSGTDTAFSCGLGFSMLSDRDVIDLEQAVALKRAKNDGDLSACSMCGESCRIRLNPAHIR